MFFREPSRLPDELILKIISNLSLKETLLLLIVSKELHILVTDNSVWNKFDAASYSDFLLRLNKLPQNYQKSVLNQEYSLEEAENMRLTEVINSVLQFPLYKRLAKVQELMPEYQIPVDDLNGDLYNHDQSVDMITGLMMRLISPEQMAKLSSLQILILLYRPKAEISALKNNINTIIEEMMSIAPRDLSGYLAGKIKEFDDNPRPLKRPRF